MGTFALVSVRRCAPTRPPGHCARGWTTGIAGSGTLDVGFGTALRAYSTTGTLCRRIQRGTTGFRTALRAYSTTGTLCMRIDKGNYWFRYGAARLLNHRGIVHGT